MTKVWKGNKAHETIENLRRLNTELLGRLNECKNANVSLKKDYAELAESFRKREDESATKDDMVHSLSAQNEKLSAELHQLKRIQEELRCSSLYKEREMMFRFCDSEEKCRNVVLECTGRMTGFKKENERLVLAMEKLHEDKIKEEADMKINIGRLHDSIHSMEQELSACREQKEEFQNACARLVQENNALKGRILKRGGGDANVDKDLGEARRAIEFLFPRWKGSTEENAKLRRELCSLESQIAELRKERELAKSASEKMQELISSLEGELAGVRQEHELTRSRLDKLKDSGAWTGVLLQRQDDRIAHLNSCLEEERAKVKDMGLNMGKLMDHLELEIKGRDYLNCDLRMARKDNKDLSDSMASLQREQMRWTNFVKWFHQRHANKFPEATLGSFPEDIETIKTRVMEMEEEMKELRDNGTKTRENHEKSLSEALAEMEIIRERDGELEKQNAALKNSYSALHQGMAKRMVSLRNHFGILKSRET